MEGDYSGCLCIGCLENGSAADFSHTISLNTFSASPTLPGTRRRFERLTGCETILEVWKKTRNCPR